MVKHSSRIYLSQSALKNNINFLQKKIGRDVKYSAVIKANAYGHGVNKMVPMLEKCGINHFSVASAQEAEEVLACCKPTSTIMIMGILFDEDLEWAIENGIEFYIFNDEKLKKAKEAAEKLNQKAIVHFEVETGTNRTGMEMPELKRAITYLKRNSAHFQFQGVCSHLGGAENKSNEFKIIPQIDRFNQMVKAIEKKGLTPKYRHLACSSAAIAYPNTRFDMVRIGVSTYGFWSSPDIYYSHLQEVGKPKDSPLKRIISWKTDVMDIKHVKEGDFIGYGTSYRVPKNKTIAVIPLGYSNGYPRALSNNGHVLIKGKKAPIVGLINMNLFMVDISHISQVEIGDEVVLLGKQKNNVINVSSFTNFTQLLNNEMLSRLPAAIPRHIAK